MVLVVNKFICFYSLTDNISMLCINVAGRKIDVVVELLMISTLLFSGEPGVPGRSV